MAEQANKLKKRASLIAANSLNSLAPPAVNVLFSLVVIKIHGTEVWGSFVFNLLWASLAAFVLNWGNKEYLLRAFSKSQADISPAWRASFFTRLLLVFPVIAVVYFSFPLSQTLLLLQWILLLFISQSFDVFVAFHRKFTQSFIVEISTGIFLLLAIIFKTAIDIYTVYLSYLAVRAALLLIIFRKDVFAGFSITLNIKILKYSFMFFMIGLTGLLGTRADQYCVSYFLSADELGRFQVLKNFLVYTHTGIGFILLPFVKNIYRMQNENIDKIAGKIFTAGALLFAPYVLLLFVITRYIFGLEFSYISYLYAGLMVLPASYYSAIIYKLFKNNRQPVVVGFNAAIIAVSVILNILLLPVLKIEGSLIAGIISQWLLLLMFYFYNKKKSDY